MADRDRNIRERAHGNAGEARLWLRENHRRLRPRMAVRWPPYAELAAEMAALGMAGGTRHDPRPLTGRAVERMWKGVCRDVAAEAAKRAPRAAPAGWTPKAVAATPPKPAPATEPAPAATDGTDYLAALRADIGKRSGRR